MASSQLDQLDQIDQLDQQKQPDVEQNLMLNKGKEKLNTGDVSNTGDTEESENETSMDEQDDSQAVEENDWKTVGSGKAKKDKRKRNSPEVRDVKKPNTNNLVISGGGSKQRLHQNLGGLFNPEHLNILFIYGNTVNISRIAYQHPVQFNREMVNRFGPLTSIKMQDNHLVVTCKNQTQKEQIKSSEEIFEISIKVIDPAKSEKDMEHVKYNKGIIFGVPTHLSEEVIMDETLATEARRIFSHKTGTKHPTESVILSYELTQDVPEKVYVGFMPFKVKEYIPRPYRCTNCQMYGHAQKTCWRNPICPRCSGNHSFDKCKNQNDEEKIRCSNCQGKHSAAWTGCPKYIQIKETLKMTVSQHISYKEALVKVKEGNEQIGKDVEQMQHREQTDKQVVKGNLKTNQENTSKDVSGKITSGSTQEPVKEKREKLAQRTSVAEQKINEIVEQIKTLEQCVTKTEEKLTGMLGFNATQFPVIGCCVIGVFLVIETLTAAMGRQGKLEAYKKQLAEHATACGLDVTQLLECPLAQT